MYYSYFKQMSNPRHTHNVHISYTLRQQYILDDLVLEAHTTYIYHEYPP